MITCQFTELSILTGSNGTDFWHIHPKLSAEPEAASWEVAPGGVMEKKSHPQGYSSMRSRSFWSSPSMTGSRGAETG
jgi:hypothetical protein